MTTATRTASYIESLLSINSRTSEQGRKNAQRVLGEEGQLSIGTLIAKLEKQYPGCSDRIKVPVNAILTDGGQLAEDLLETTGLPGEMIGHSLLIKGRQEKKRKDAPEWLLTASGQLLYINGLISLVRPGGALMLATSILHEHETLERMRRELSFSEGCASERIRKLATALEGE